MLAIIHDRAIPIPAHVGQRAGCDYCARKNGWGFVGFPNNTAIRKLRQAGAHHAATGQQSGPIVGPRMHNCAVTNIYAVVHVGHGCARKTSFHS